MIELTPLDVRKKRGDFAKALRGYEAQEVDVFLELVAERMGVLVKENLQLRERSERLGEQVKGQEGREQAVQEALVTAQELRQDVKEQAKREAELLEREARGRIEQMMQEAETLLSERRAALEELERHRTRFLKAFRTLLERELDSVEVESNRTPLEDITLDFELGRGSWTKEDDVGDESEDEAHAAEALDAGDEDAELAAAEGDDGTPEPEAFEREEDSRSADSETMAEAEAVGEAESVSEIEPVEGAETEEAGGAVPEDSLWLSSILKRDQQESD